MRAQTQPAPMLVAPQPVPWAVFHAARLVGEFHLERAEAVCERLRREDAARLAPDGGGAG